MTFRHLQGQRVRRTVGSHTAPRTPRPHPHLQRTTTPVAARRVHQALQRAPPPPQSQPTRPQRRGRRRPDRNGPHHRTAQHLRRADQRVQRRRLIVHQITDAKARQLNRSRRRTPRAPKAPVSHARQHPKIAADAFSAPSGWIRGGQRIEVRLDRVLHRRSRGGRVAGSLTPTVVATSSSHQNQRRHHAKKTKPPHRLHLRWSPSRSWSTGRERAARGKRHHPTLGVHRGGGRGVRVDP